MAYILIAYLSFSNSNGGPMAARFLDKAACDAAIAEMDRKYSERNPKRPSELTWPRTVAICVPEGSR